MGINPGTGVNNKNFAVEVLKVEISGPQRPHFSILDIPGTVNNDFNLRPGEKLGISNMVAEYMKQPQNIVMYGPHNCLYSRLHSADLSIAVWPTPLQTLQDSLLSNWPRFTWKRLD